MNRSILRAQFNLYSYGSFFTSYKMRKVGSNYFYSLYKFLNKYKNNFITDKKLLDIEKKKLK